MWLSFCILLPYVMIDKKQDMCLMDNVKLKGVNTNVGRVSEGALGITWASFEHYSLKPYEYQFNNIRIDILTLSFFS